MSGSLSLVPAGKRVIITDRNTGMFCRRNSRWSAERKEASDFGTVLDAYDFARQHHLAHTDAIIAFEDSRYDVRVPVVP